MARTQKKQPLYNQLVDSLHEKIDNELGPGDLLPSERDLCEQYGLSRTTVRLALAELESQGLVTRRHGKGTFVSDAAREATNLMSTYSFTEQMRSMGKVPRTEMLEFGVCPAPRHIANLLGIKDDEAVVRMRRLRIADDVPLMIECTYLPGSEFGDLTEQDMANMSLYEVMDQKFHETVRVAEEEFCASVAGKDEAELLDIGEGVPVLRLYRTTYNTKNVAIECTRSVARADQFRYKVYHHRS